MLAEFVKSLVDLFRSGQEVKIVPIPGDDRNVIVRQPDGNLDMRAIPAPGRRHVVRSLNDFVDMLKRSSIAKSPEVYFGPLGASAFLDADDRRDYVFMPLEFTERWKTIESLAKGSEFTQASLIRFLRFDLHGSVGDSLIAKLRTIDFKRSSNGKRTEEHGREALGKSVEAAIQGTSDIPESFGVAVHPIQNDGLRSVLADVRVGIHIDLDNEKFVLRLLADELPNARQSTVRQFAKDLRSLLGAEVPVFDGEAVAK